MYTIIPAICTALKLTLTQQQQETLTRAAVHRDSTIRILPMSARITQFQIL